MKKLISIILLLVIVTVIMSGCQGATRSLGGIMTLELATNTKLELITWKDDSLWYLTRPMREGEEAETHIYKQSSEFGVFEGKVTIIEKKETAQNDNEKV